MFARSSRDCCVCWMVFSFWVRVERDEERDSIEVWVEESFDRCAESSFCWSSSLKVRSRKLEEHKNDAEGGDERIRIEARKRGGDQSEGDQNGRIWEGNLYRLLKPSPTCKTELTTPLIRTVISPKCLIPSIEIGSRSLRICRGIRTP